MQPRARRLADREEPGDRRRAVEAGDDPAHPVVRRGGHRDELARRVDAGPAQHVDDVREERRVDRAHVEVHVSAPVAAIRSQIARATSSRGASSSTNRSPCGVEQRGALAPDGLRDEEPLAARDPGHRGRVELHELEVRERAPASGRAAGRCPASRAGSSSATTAPRCRRSKHDGARPHRSAVLAHDADASAVRGPQARRPRRLEDRDALVADDEGGQVAHHPPPGRAAAGVDDAAARVAALEAERQVAVAVGVEDDAEALELLDGPGRLAHEDLGGRPPHEAAAGALGVLPVELGGVVGRQRRGDPALRPVARRLRQRGGRHERDERTGPGRRERREEPGAAGADDHDIGLRARGVGVGGGHWRGTVLPWRARSCSTTRRPSGTTPAPTGAVQRMVAVERALEAVGWLGADVRPAPEATWEQLEAVHDPAYLGRLEAFCARGGGMLDPDTVGLRGLLGGGAARGRRRGRARRRAAGRRGGVGAPRCTARPATTRRATGRWASACSTTSRSPRGTRSTPTAWSACSSSTGTCTTATARRPSSTREPRVLFASVHESPLYPARARPQTSASGPGEGFTVNVPVPGGSGDATWCSLVEHALVPLGLAYAPELVLVSAGFDAHERRPAGGLRGDRRRASRPWPARARRLAEALGVPLGLVLEGGYDLGALTRSLVASLGVLAADAAPAAPAGLAVDPHARAALERLRARWPALA